MSGGNSPRPLGARQRSKVISTTLDCFEIPMGSTGSFLELFHTRYPVASVKHHPVGFYSRTMPVLLLFLLKKFQQIELPLHRNVEADFKS
mmetsp:Transcript_18758/g.53389  ORF Transcript_18758/g.53389 Transcript_18758/m.53389 type:complete len:90 (+) Transcript_18758:501-770(+)